MTCDSAYVTSYIGLWRASHKSLYSLSTSQRPPHRCSRSYGKECTLFYMFHHPSGDNNLQRRLGGSGQEGRVPLPDIVDDILRGSAHSSHHNVLRTRPTQSAFTNQATPSHLSALNFVRLAIWKDWGTKRESSSLREILSKENAEVRTTSLLQGETQPKIGGLAGGFDMQLLDE